MHVSIREAWAHAWHRLTITKRVSAAFVYVHVTVRKPGDASVLCVPLCPRSTPQMMQRGLRGQRQVRADTCITAWWKH